jgi:diguanylate cyclase (GGDEF)-like protein
MTPEPSNDTEDINPQPDMTIIAENVVRDEAAVSCRASLIVLAGPDIGRTIELDPLPHTVGRSPVSDSVVGAGSVSRQHARLEQVDEAGEKRYRIVDLASSNGTWVNNVRVTESPLRNGDRVTLGDVLLKFVLQDEVESRFQRELQRRLNYDQLTGLLTMESFRARLATAIQLGSPGAYFTLAMTDLDGLKKVNDSYGHLAGRMIIREMGLMMRQTLREQDLGGLYGGDEAILLFPNTRMEEAADVCEGLRTKIHTREFEHLGNSFGVSISQGLAEWPRHGNTAEELIAAADRALYAAKARGRNCVVDADHL